MGWQNCDPISTDDTELEAEVYNGRAHILYGDFLKKVYVCSRASL